MKPLQDKAIREQAAEWLLTLEGGGTAQERAAYAKWLLDSPRHVEEALAVEALYRAYEGVDPDKRIPLGPIPVESSIFPLRANTPPPATQTGQRRRILSIGFGIAASLLICAGLYLSGVLSAGSAYATKVGEQRAVELPDGSVAHLNTHSKIRVDFSDTAREIRLLEGEALFRVAKNANRPFRVLVDRAAIQAVGTQFNVYRRAAGVTTVSVLEGAVRISAGEPNFTAGDVVSLLPDGRIDKLKDVDAAEVVAAWRQRRLRFNKDTLADVVAEFNRYNSTAQLQVREPDVAERRLTGQFDADDPKALLRFLADDPTLRFERSGNTTLITSSAHLKDRL